MENRIKLLYFLLFAGLGVLMPYAPVFFELLSMSKSQIGVLSMLPNLCAFLLAPLFGVIGDMFDAHCEVIVFSTLASVVCTLFILNTQTFASMIWVVFSASAFRAPLTPQVDSLVINSLEDKSRYGEMRLWGAIGFGIMSFVGGALTQDHTIEAFKFNFFTHAGLFVASCLIVLWLVYDMLASPEHAKAVAHMPSQHSTTPADGASTPKRTMWEGLKHVFIRHPSVLVFTAIVFLSGIGTGVIESFLFLRLKQLGGSGLVMGISRFITCAAEVPLFHMAGRWHQRYGTWVMLAVTQVGFVLRFTYYSFLTEPWAVLPCEVLHGLTFAVMWSVSCTYANMISPPECHSTMQALLEGLHWGFGSGVGALVGGFIYDQYGPVWLFEMSASLSFLSLVLALLAVRYAEKDSALDDEYSSLPATGKRSTDMEDGEVVWLQTTQAIQDGVELTAL